MANIPLRERKIYTARQYYGLIFINFDLIKLQFFNKAVSLLSEILQKYKSS